MVVVAVVAAVILVVSLADFMGSNGWSSITSFNRNQDVFENRNKAYGAYQLRKNYNKRLIAIMCTLCLGFGAAFAAKTMFKKQAVAEVASNVPSDIDLFDYKDKKDDLVKPEPLPETNKDCDKQLAEKQIEFIAPIVSDKIPQVIDPIDPELKVGDITIVDPNPFGTGKAIDTTNAVDLNKVKKDDETIFKPGQLTEAPSYVGGRDAMINFISRNIDANNLFTDKVEVKIWTKFVVSNLGKIIRVSKVEKAEYCEGCFEEAERILYKMPTWIPGRLDGEAKNGWCTLPIIIHL